MTPIAWIVFLAAIGYTILDGVRRTRGAKDLEGFFAAGRSIPWWAAGLSVMATQLSAITLLGGVGMGYENGLEWVQFYFALPFAMIILCIWFVPAFRQHPILTAYQFLERRFGPVTRSLTSLVFLLSRCLAFAVVLYAPAVVFSVMTGLPIAPTVWITGLITTAYTVIGGTGGVVWTDVKQMALIFFGILVCFVFLLWDTLGELGGGGVLRALGAAGKLNPIEITNAQWTFVPAALGEDTSSSFWADKYNLWTGLFGTLFLFLSYFGCDQSQVQGILTSKSVDASRRALLMSAFTKVPLQLMVLLLGGLLYLHQGLAKEPLLYQPNDEKAAEAIGDEHRAAFTAAEAAHTAAAERRRTTMLAIGAGTADDATFADFRAATKECADARKVARTAVNDSEVARGARSGEPESDSNYIFPHYLFQEMPKPLLGLMLAAIFAAAISSAAGALSSLTSATMVDFYRRWYRPQASETTMLRHSRIVMAAWGILATAAAIWLGGGPLLEKVNEVGSYFYGSILGVFVLALFVPRAGGRAASAGLIGGLLTIAIVHNTLKIAYLWYNLLGCAGCVAVGLAVALAMPNPRAIEQRATTPIEDPTRNWPRIYLAVAVAATAVMFLLWLMGTVAKSS
ncbi:MAG: sodium:solute symporter [Planctomycetes bacterium]|nr:sodium:solute symporter [Planctomycetota bacterium]